MTDILETIESVGIPCAYGVFKEPVEPPFMIYMGEGQESFIADNTMYVRGNTYRVEYYFTKKSKDTEAKIEQALLDGGYLYAKSEDIYLDDEDLFAIYYYTQ